jgi:biopolymer transport protein ExbD
MRLLFTYVILSTVFCLTTSSEADSYALENLEKALSRLGENFAGHFQALRESGQIPSDIKIPDFIRPGLKKSATDEDRLEALDKQVNVFIDAMHLLPITQSFGPVTLPEKSKPKQKPPVIRNIYIQADGTIYLQKTKLPTVDSLIQKLRSMTDDLASISLIISAHPDTKYSHLASLLKTIRENGIGKVAMQ